MIEAARRVAWTAFYRVRHSDTLAVHRELDASQWRSGAEVQEAQWRRLSTVLEHALTRVPYYRERAQATGTTLAEIQTLADFRRLTPISKEDIRDHLEALCDPDLRRQAIRNSTGGSTGVPLRVYQDQAYLRHNRAATIRHDSWTGWMFGEPVLRLWGAPRDVHVPTRQRLGRWLAADQTVNAFELSERALEDACRRLESLRPRLLVGYASALAALASHLKAGDRRVDHRLRAVVSSGEVLDQDSRTLIQESLGVRVFDRYGCRELGLIASECAEGSLHVNADCLYVEQENPGAESPLLVTTLTNRAMPLIRYRIGDVGQLSGAPCRCKRGLPVLARLAGRTTDFVVRDDGSLISGPALTLLFRDVAEVAQAQLFQAHRGSLVVRLVRGRGYDTSTEEALARRLRAYLGAGTAVEFEYRQEIPPEPSGKYRFTISSAAPAQFTEGR